MGGCRLGALARHKAERGDLLALLICGDQHRTAIELIHDVEDALFNLLRRGPGREQSTDPEMCHGPLAFSDECVRRLLNTVVEEHEGAVRAYDETGPDGFPERCVDRFLARAVNHAKRRR